MLNFIKKWRWGFLSLIFLAFCFIEISNARTGQSSIVFELLVFLSLIVSAGVLLNYLVQALDQQTQMMKLLESKYKLAQALTTHMEWSELTTALAQFPSEVTAADQAALLLKNPITQQFESISGWRAASAQVPDPRVEAICLECLEIDPGKRAGLQAYTAPDGTSRTYYSLPIQHNRDLIAFIQFRLKAGTTLSKSEQELFENLTTDLTIALTAGHDRTRLAELRALENKLAEQQANPRHLHSHLDQHIGQLRAKLDRLRDNPSLNIEEMRAEITNLSEAAQVSYDAIQSDLKATHPDTPQLNGVLHEYARQVSQRAGIILTFKAEGRQLPIEAEVQKVVCGVFQEAFKNIEKHARATKVSVFVGWAFDILTISITDNGVGFDPIRRNGANHLGLERMNERITALGGQIDLRSQAGEGSTITFIIPNLSERLRGPTPA